MCQQLTVTIMTLNFICLFCLFELLLSAVPLSKVSVVYKFKHKILLMIPVSCVRVTTNF